MNITIEATGFVGTIGSLGRTDRVSLFLPMSPAGIAVLASYESTNLSTHSTMADGTGVDLGKQAAKIYVLGFGGNF